MFGEGHSALGQHLYGRNYIAVSHGHPELVILGALLEAVQVFVLLNVNKNIPGKLALGTSGERWDLLGIVSLPLEGTLKLSLSFFEGIAVHRWSHVRGSLPGQNEVEDTSQSEYIRPLIDAPWSQ